MNDFCKSKFCFSTPRIKKRKSCWTLRVTFPVFYTLNHLYSYECCKNTSKTYLMWWYCIVSLSCSPDGSVDETVEHNKDYYGDKCKTEWVGNEHIVSAVVWILAKAGRLKCQLGAVLWQVDLHFIAEASAVFCHHFSSKLKKSGDVEDQWAGHNGQSVGQVVIVVATCLQK